ncbi:CheR methyltransferase SAM-binding domain-containing protein [Campylobacter hyointestinalis]|uniref:CheR family methyltransferase n=1 Tax=Campylobacter hyointestinalis TaxID=198 RepID=UPI0007293E8B|nr:CheR family methyltransferase [Campylobacter hyointestinalis]CUU74801.1 CheR methyltransferase SAM-binding domain-containing protein [Campylobacter hyointestinalis]
MNDLSLENLDKILDAAKRFSGNDLANKKGILKHRITNFAALNSIDDADELIQKISYDSSLRQKFINLITVNETYFYRELRQLNAIIEYANSLEGYVNILCIPCSSGDEVYSLAILTKAVGIANKVKIIGLDINSDVIDQAKKGIYSKRAVKNLHQKELDVYFTKIEDKFKIKKELLGKIEFKQANLFDPEFLKLGIFDIISSRNMLIYFDEVHRLNAIERFAKILKPNGRLYVGNADLVPHNDTYKKVINSSTSYYEKL